MLVMTFTKDNPLRFGRLKQMAKSPAHFFHDPGIEGRAISVGSAAHAMILETGKFAAWEEGRPRRGKEFDAFKASQAPGTIILTHSEMEQAKGIDKAVRANKDAMRVLDGVREKTIYWEEAGIICRGTPDAISDKYRADLKTGETADPREFAWKAVKFQYHAQLAWYEDGSRLERENYLVAVEQKWPHIVTVFRLQPKVMDMARRLYRSWLERLRVCMDSDFWPGYVQSVADLELPDLDADPCFDQGENDE
jgi:hypothetical protein